MNSKTAKLLRKRIKEVFHVPSIGRGVYQSISRKEIRDASDNVVGSRTQTVLDIKCPRAIYQRTKRITSGKSTRRIKRRTVTADGLVKRVSES